jgi:hypothetical protein
MDWGLIFVPASAVVDREQCIGIWQGPDPLAVPEQHVAAIVVRYVDVEGKADAHTGLRRQRLREGHGENRLVAAKLRLGGLSIHPYLVYGHQASKLGQVGVKPEHDLAQVFAGAIWNLDMLFAVQPAGFRVEM